MARWNGMNCNLLVEANSPSRQRRSEGVNVLIFFRFGSEGGRLAEDGLELAVSRVQGG